MEPEAADRVGFMSKAEILRVIITERLTAAAQEIFAVVERTLAGYEEEVSGCRQEIDLQRNQLGVLLHPPVKLETEDDDYMIPISEPTAEEASEGGGGGDEDVLHAEEQQQQQQQQKFELSVEDDGSMALLCYTGVETHDEEEEEDEDEEGGEDEFSEQLGLTPVEDQDETTELDYEEVSRSLSPTVQTDRRSVGRPRVSDLRSHVDLRICILENSHIEILSTRVFQTYPMRELRCPCGLQEADFLDLLRSAFPQLAANEPFDIFWSDRSRLLKPLNVKALTPEEISSTIKSTGAGKSPLYIRLKTMSVSTTSPPSAADSPHNYVHLRICILKNPKINVILPRGFKNCPVQELKCPRGLPEADFLDLLRSTFPQLAGDKPFDLFTTDRSRMLRPLRVETLTPEKIAKTIKSTGAGKSALYIRLKTLSVPTKSHPSAANSSHNHVTLRICILDNPKINVILPRAFKKWPVQELKCPRGLQEADFLDLLRSTFPQLEGNKPFDVFTIDRNRTLKPLRVEALTPEKIGKTIKSRGKSALYIRLKPFDKEMKPIRPPQRKDAAAENSHSKLDTSAQSGRRGPGRPRRSDPQSYVDLSLRLLEDPQVNVLSDRVFREYPLQELKCPCGLQEPDFVDLLRSTFPQLAGDKPFDILTSDRSRTLYPLRMKNLTPEGVYRTMRSLRHSGIYIRLKAPEKKPNTAAAKDSPSTSNPGRSRTSPVQQQERNGVDFPFIFSASEQRGKYTEKADDGNEDHEWLESPSLWSLPLSETDQDEEEVDGRGDNWKPPKADENLRNKKPEKRKSQQIDDSAVQTKRRRIRSSLQVLTGRNNNGPLTCRVCGIVRRSTRMLIKHSWRHVDDAGRLCGVCGEQSTSAELLRVHLQSHQKTHSCNICGKSLLSISGLSGHLARHRGEKPHKCKICHKAFAEKWTLNNHMWIHVKDKPHKCDICQTSYASKQKLRLHRVKHVEEKPYSCSTCTSSFSTLKTLSKHMLTHSSSSGEKPYACDICSKRYSLNKRLQSHLRSHTSQWPNGCSTCNKQFTCKAKLVMHMRNHTS